MKKTFLFIVTLALSSVAFCQYNVNGVSDLTDKARHTQQNVKVNNFDRNATRKTKFNVFLNENWQGGVMFSKDSVNLNGFTYRYNIYADQIEMRSLVDPSTIDVVTIGAQKFIHASYVDIDNNLLNGYFELVVGGDVKLLLRREIDFKQATNDIEGYGASSSTSVKEEFYIKKDNNPAVKLEKSKDFFKDLMNDKDEVVDYIDKQIILFFTEKKVKEIIEYYNQI